ncbi:hypothetical protein GGR54DRAFT_573820 [Hypoxylon sp. NC1633]|nr:hypothetical protein GGR54DRAFT_573820 [Hypoxylon sp. NC1633]
MASASIATEPMASGAFGSGSSHQLAQNGMLNPTDLNEIREYQKVTTFRDTVTTGKHSRIKVAKPITTTSQPPSASLAAGRVASSFTEPHKSAPNRNTYQADNMQSFFTNSQQPAVAVDATGSTAPIPGFSNSRPLDLSKTNGVKPFPPEKTEDSHKAEFRLRRLKVEQELRDQFERQQKASVKVFLEQQPDPDLADILAKALTLLQATAPVPPITGTPNVDSTDSLDNTTFYSSPTPERSRASTRTRNAASQDVQMPDTPASVPRPQQMIYASQQEQVAPHPVHTSAPQELFGSRYNTPNQNMQSIQSASSFQHSQPIMTGLTMPVQDHAVHHQSSKTGSLEGYVTSRPRQIREIETHIISSDSGAASRSDNSGNTDSDQPADRSRAQNQHQLLPSAHFKQQESPLVRGHDLSPLAPQPAHVSPLATARRPPMQEPELSILPAAPAQVTALRQEHGAVTGSEKVPLGDKGSKKKRQKKSKRRAEVRVSDAPGSPDIKPEPRSPSPLSAPRFAQPQKRVRSTRQDQEAVYDGTQIEGPVSVLHRERFAGTQVQTERTPYGFERAGDAHGRQVRQSVAPASQRSDRTLYEERRPDGTTVQYIQQVQSPYGYTSPYGAGTVESRPLRSASYSVNPQYHEGPTYQRDGRMSVRPYPDRARSRSPAITERRSPVMAPPTYPSRIVVDQFGREYIDPSRPGTVARHSVVPAPRPGEREVIYERVPLRAATRMPGETFEEDGIIYRRASPAYAPRRVITQPEYGVDYRNYRERDYSVQPVGEPGQDIVTMRAGAERRGPEAVSREYLPRAASVRPAEAVPYHSRFQTARPDVPQRQYAASVHPEVRRDTAASVMQDFSVRPAERDVPRQEFSVRPVERYYDRPSHTDGVTYLERARAAQQEVIYADNSRRQVYQ